MTKLRITNYAGKAKTVLGFIGTSLNNISLQVLIKGVLHVWWIQ
jgi:hypothetical protein